MNLASPFRPKPHKPHIFLRRGLWYVNTHQGMFFAVKLKDALSCARQYWIGLAIKVSG